MIFIVLSFGLYCVTFIEFVSVRAEKVNPRSAVVSYNGNVVAAYPTLDASDDVRFMFVSVYDDNFHLEMMFPLQVVKILYKSPAIV